MKHCIALPYFTKYDTVQYCKLSNPIQRLRPTKKFQNYKFYVGPTVSFKYLEVNLSRT